MHNPTTINNPSTTTSTPPRRWVTLLLVASFSALLALPWIERPFHTRGEPREALVAQAMLRHSNWISPPAYDASVPSKPPFLHWLIASAASLTGSVSELSARLPSSCAVVLFSLAMALALIPKGDGDHASCLATVLILLASSEWFRGASTCRVDMLLATSAAGALLALFKWWELTPHTWSTRGVNSREPAQLKGNLSLYFVLSALILCAAATLTKGPIGVVITLAPFSLFVWGEAGFRFKALARIALRGALIAFVALSVASIWYILGYLERGAAFIEKVRYENFERFTSQMVDEPHKHSSLYLIAMLALGLLPWTGILCACALVKLKKARLFSYFRLKSSLKLAENSGVKGANCGAEALPGNKIGTRACLRFLSWLRLVGVSRAKRGLQATYSGYRSLAPLERFSCVVVAFTVIFFCIPSSKRSVYLLPCYPFLAILLERIFRKVASDSVWSRRCNRLSAVVLTFSAVAVFSVLALYGVFYFFSELKLGGYFRLDYRYFILSVTLFKVVVLAVILNVLFSKVCRSELKALWHRPIERLALAVISAVVACSFFIYDPLAWQLSPKGWVLGDLRIKGARYYSYGSEAYGASFYLGEQFFSITTQRGLEGGAASRLMVQGREVGLSELAGGVVFLDARREAEFREALGGVLGGRYEVIARHASGVERAGRDVLVVRVGG